jgi:hypothetical protein
MQSGSLLLEHEPQPEQIEQLEQLAELCEESAAPEIVDAPVPEPPARPSERDLILQRAAYTGLRAASPTASQG